MKHLTVKIFHFCYKLFYIWQIAVTFLFLRMIQEDLQCVICWEIANNPKVTACCGQLLCLVCLNTYVITNHKCPYCRASLRTNSDKCITRITKKLIQNEYSNMSDVNVAGPSRQRHRSEPVSRKVKNICWRVNPRQGWSSKVGSSGKFYCNKLRSQHNIGKCCVGECSNFCGPDKGCNCWVCMMRDRNLRGLKWGELVNREGHTAWRGNTGIFYCDRLVSQGASSPDLSDNHLTSHQLMEQIIANELSNINDTDSEDYLAIAVQLSLEIGNDIDNPGQAWRCTANDPCMACICLTRHSNEYL